MKLSFNYGSRVLVLPAEALLARAGQATKQNLLLLLRLAAELQPGADYEAIADRIAAEAGVSRADLDRALSFWQGAGVISAEEEGAEQGETAPVAPPQPESKPLEHETELPHYTTEQLTHLLEGRAEAKSLVDAAQQTFGKMFTTMETNIVLGMLDYLSLEEEYILTLLAWCAGQGKKSMRYAEKVAIGLWDEGIRDAEALNLYLRRREAQESLGGKIRAIFGAQDRTLTQKEKNAVRRWIEEYRYTAEIVSRAYELTVNAISKPSIPYADSILGRWHAAGLETIEEIDADIASRTHDKQGEQSASNSFDTDEFFEDALRRCYSS
ncbi:MAG: DnaD domain protein [Clostridia bacterium]|nr:DnaD domain protein [Clostridia bacterium]